MEAFGVRVPSESRMGHRDENVGNLTATQSAIVPARAKQCCKSATAAKSLLHPTEELRKGITNKMFHWRLSLVDWRRPQQGRSCLHLAGHPGNRSKRDAKGWPYFMRVSDLCALPSPCQSSAPIAPEMLDACASARSLRLLFCIRKPTAWPA